MGVFQIVMAVLAVNVSVLGIAFVMVYGFNKAVSQSGR
jgi:hypothetical protein